MNFFLHRKMTSPNIARDELNAQRLDTLSWTVITVWECELSKKNRDATIARIEADLQAAKTKYELRATFLGKVYILVVCFKRKVYICDRNYNGKVYASKKAPV